MKLKSGIGKFPIPVTHAMTLGEFAQMINGEGWLPDKMQSMIRVVPVGNYAHDREYVLPVNPYPNVKRPQSVLLFPSLCYFEGTIVSQGRDTLMPFTVLGSPALKDIYPFSFSPLAYPAGPRRPCTRTSFATAWICGSMT